MECIENKGEVKNYRRIAILYLDKSPLAVKNIWLAASEMSFSSLTLSEGD